MLTSPQSLVLRSAVRALGLALSSVLVVTLLPNGPMAEAAEKVPAGLVEALDAVVLSSAEVEAGETKSVEVDEALPLDYAGHVTGAYLSVTTRGEGVAGDVRFRQGGKWPKSADALFGPEGSRTTMVVADVEDGAVEFKSSAGADVRVTLMGVVGDGSILGADEALVDYWGGLTLRDVSSSDAIGPGQEVELTTQEGVAMLSLVVGPAAAPGQLVVGSGTANAASLLEFEPGAPTSTTALVQVNNGVIKLKNDSTEPLQVGVRALAYGARDVASPVKTFPGVELAQQAGAALDPHQRRVKVYGPGLAPQGSSTALLRVSVPKPTTAGFVSLGTYGNVNRVLEYSAGQPASALVLQGVDWEGFVELSTLDEPQVKVELVGYRDKWENAPKLQQVNAQALDGGVVLDWREDAKGAAYYRVSSPGREDVLVQSPVRHAKVLGLENGSEYNFTVTPVMADGLRGAASPVVKATPSASAARPAPVDVTLKAFDSMVGLSWTPLDTSGVDNYQVVDGSGAVVAWQYPGGGYEGTQAAAYIKNGLYGAYRVRVNYLDGTSATSALAWSEVSEADKGRPEVPAAPTGITLEPHNGSLVASWQPGDANAWHIIAVQPTASWSTGASYAEWVAPGVTTKTLSGLVNGQAHKVSVRAVGDYESYRQSASAEATSTPELSLSPAPGLTGTPMQGLAAQPHGNAVTLTWEPFAQSTRILVKPSSDPRVRSIYAQPGQGSVVVHGLEPGIPTTFQVTQVDPQGKPGSWTSTPDAVVVDPALPDVPGAVLAPQDMTLTPGPSSIELAWTPAGDWDDSLTVIAEPTGDGKPVAFGTALTLGSTTITGLVPGVEYSVKAYTTRWSLGADPQSRLVSAGVAVPLEGGSGPSSDRAPTGVTAVPGNGRVELNWDWPQGFGIYTLVLSDGSTRMVDSFMNPFQVGGLTNGQEYSFKLCNWGWGVSSGDESLCAPAVTATPQPHESALPAPGGLAVESQWGSVKVTWQPFLAASGYVVHYKSVTGSGEQNGAWGFDAATTEFTLNDLDPTRAYSFTVTARDASGEEGVASPPVGPVWPNQDWDKVWLPSAPTALVYEKAARVSWKAPEKEVVGYWVSVHSSGLRGGERVYTPSPTVLVDGLSDGESYSFSVEAISKHGTLGHASQGSNEVTPVAEAGAPVEADSGLTLRAGERAGSSVVALWSRDESFIAELSEDADFEDPKRATGSAGYVKFTGLTPGTAYHVRVRSFAADPWVSSEVTTAAKPDPLLEMSAVPRNDTSAEVTWLEQGDVELEHKVTEGDGAWVPDGIHSGTGAVVEGLTEATNYTFRARQVHGSEAGEHVHATATTPYPLPTPDLRVAVDPSDPAHSLVATLDGVSEWELQWSKGEPYVASPAHVDGDSSFVISDLEHSSTYKVRARALEGARRSAWVEVSVKTLHAPGAPQDLVGALTPTGADLSWKEVEDEFVTAWDVEWSIREDFSQSTSLRVSSPSAALDLYTSRKHFVRVRAMNAVGTSDWSRTNVKQADPLEPPRNFAYTTADNEVRLSWEPPGNGTPEHYQVFRGDVLIRITPGLTFIDKDVTPGAYYDYVVLATDRFFEPGLGARLDDVRALPTPPVVEGVHALAGNGTITVTWQANPRVTEYEVYLDDELVTTTMSLQAVVPTQNGVTYTVSVVGRDAYAQSGPRASASARPFQPGVGETGRITTDRELPLAPGNTTSRISLGGSEYLLYGNRIAKITQGAVTYYGDTYATCQFGEEQYTFYYYPTDMVALDGMLYVTDRCGIRSVDPLTGFSKRLSTEPSSAKLAAFDGQLYAFVGTSITVLSKSGEVLRTGALPAGATPVKALTADDGVYLAANTNGRSIYKISSNGSAAHVFTGNFNAESTTVLGDEAYFTGNYSSGGYFWSGEGILRTCRIYALHIPSGAVRFLVGSGSCGTKDGEDDDAWIPASLSLSSDGNGVLSFIDGALVRKVRAGQKRPTASSVPSPPSTLDASVVRVEAFSGNGNPASASGTAGTASFFPGSSFAVDGSYAVTMSGGGLRKVDLQTGSSTLVSGLESGSSCLDSPTGPGASFRAGAAAVAVSSDSYYVASCGIRRVSKATGAVTKVAGVPDSAVIRGMTYSGGSLYVLGGVLGNREGVDKVDVRTGQITSVGSISWPYSSSVLDGEVVPVGAVVFADGQAYYALRKYNWSSGYSYLVMRTDLQTGSSSVVAENPHFFRSYGSSQQPLGVLYTSQTHVYVNSAGRVLGLPLESAGSQRYVVGNGLTETLKVGTGTDAEVDPTAGFSSQQGTFLFSHNRLLKLDASDPLPATTLVNEGTGPVGESLVATTAGTGASVNADGDTPSFSEVGGSVRVGNDLYVTSGSGIRKVNMTTGASRLFAGSYTESGCLNSTNPAHARFRGAGSITSDGHYLYLSGYSDTPINASRACPVRRVNLETGAVSFVPTTGELHGLVHHKGFLYAFDNSAKYIHNGGVVRINPTTGAASTVIEYVPPPNSSWSYTWRASFNSMAFVGDELYVSMTETYSSPYGFSAPAQTYHLIKTTPGVGTGYITLRNDWPQPAQDLEAIGSNVYAAAGNAVFKVDPSNSDLRLVAGSMSASYKDGFSAKASMTAPTALFSDEGRLGFFSDGRLRKTVGDVSLQQVPSRSLGGLSLPKDVVVSTIAGNGSAINAAGTPEGTSFLRPSRVVTQTVDGKSKAYVLSENVVFEVDLSTGVSTIFAGDPSQANLACEVGLSADSLRFSRGSALATDGEFLYVGTTSGRYQASSYGGEYYCGLIRIDLKTRETVMLAPRLGFADVVVGADRQLYATVGDPYYSKMFYRIDPLTAKKTMLANYGFTGTFGYEALSGQMAARGDKIYVTARPQDAADGKTSTPIYIYNTTTQSITRGGDMAGSQFTAIAITDAGVLYSSTGTEVSARPAGGGEGKVLAGLEGVASAADGTRSNAGFTDVGGFAALDDKRLLVTSNNRLRVISTQKETLAEGGPTLFGEVSPVGALTTSVEDLSVPSAGPEVGLHRTYDSSMSTIKGVFGYGWTSTFDARTFMEGEDRVVVLPNGARRYFLKDDGEWKSASRVPDELEETSSGFELELFGGGSYVFDAAGAVSAVKDDQGKRVDFVRTAGSVALKDSVRTLLTATLDGGGRVVKVSDPMNQVTTYAYETSGALAGTLKSVSAPGNAAGGTRTTTYTYRDGATKLLASIKDYTGAGTYYTYDGSLRLSSITNPSGGYTVKGYTTKRFGDTEGGVESDVLVTTWVDGVMTEEEHYSDGNLIRKAQNHNGQLVDVAKYTYHHDTNNLDKVTDANGGVTELEYYGTGKIKSQTDPMGRTSSWAYDDNGLPQTSKTAEGVETNYHYDAQRRLTRSVVKGSSGQAGPVRETTYAYTDAANPGAPTRVTEPDGTWTEFTYSNLGLVTKSKLSTGETTTYAYDAMGRKLSEIAPGGNINLLDPQAIFKFGTFYTYYPSGDLKSVKTQGNPETSYTYDDSARTTTERYPDGAATVLTENAFGMPVQVLAPGSLLSTASYTNSGDLVASTDEGGKTTSYTYDALGRLTAMATSGPGAATLTASNTYDALGNLKSTTLPSGLREDYAYDKGNNLIRTNRTGGPSTTYGYTSAGRLASVKEVEGGAVTKSTSYSYSGLGELLQLERDGRAVGYTYDSAGRLAKTTYPSNGPPLEVRYNYQGGRLTSLGDNLGHSADFAYHATGELASTTLGNGLKTSYTYDAGRFKGLNATFAGNSVLSTSATFNNLNQVTTLSSAGLGSTPKNYSYDSARRLTQAGSKNYGYDAGGNLVANGAKAQEYSGLDVITKSGLSSYGYDADLNRVSAINGDVTTSYGYDASGLLTQAGTSTLAYGSDGLLTQANGDDLFVDGSGLLTDGDQAYVWGPTGPLWRTSGDDPGETQYYLTDESANVRAVLSEHGAVLARANYDELGNFTESSGDLGLLKAGSLLDVGAGLLTGGDGAYYEPSTGSVLAPMSVPSTQREDEVYGDGRAYAPWAKRHVKEIVQGVVVAIVVAGVVGTAATAGLGAPLALAVVGGAISIAATFSDNEALAKADLVMSFVNLPQGALKSVAKKALLESAGASAQRYARAAAFETNSFAAGTPVLMADGTSKPIEEVALGDRVLASDPETGETSPQEVSGLIRGWGEKELVDVTTADGSRFSATAAHPLWSETEQAWVLASQLEVGDGLRLEDGTQTRVTALEVRTVGYAEVYNLTVEGTHTYFVAGGVLVHNAVRLHKTAWSPTHNELRGLGQGDSHHIIQNAAVRNGSGYNYGNAPTEALKGGASVPGTAHYNATQVQRNFPALRRGTYGAERLVAYMALRAAGHSPKNAKRKIARADEYFIKQLHWTFATPTRIPWS